MTAVNVEDPFPVAIGLAFSLNSSMKARTTLLVDDPLVENAMVFRLVEIGQLLEFGRGLGIPIIGRPGRLRPDDAHRCALGVGRHRPQGTDCEAKIDRAGDHRLQRFTAAGGVNHLQGDAVLLEDAGLGAELRNRRVPVAALPDGELEEVVSACRRRWGKQNRGGKRQCEAGGGVHGYPPWDFGAGD